jgi:LacI family transcriptional regulator
MRPTLSAIAERSGFSKATVSQILNRQEDLFRPETVRKVLAAARELDYRPNAAARGTRRGRFGCVALLVSTHYYRSNLPVGLLGGIHEALASRDLHLVLAKLPDEKLTNEGYVPKILREWMADGLLINYNVDIPARMVELIEKHGIPSVWMNAKRHTDCVCPDDLAAGREATERLIGLGHSAIAYVDTNYRSPQLHYSKIDRHAGYAEAMTSAGFEPVLNTGPGAKSGESRLSYFARWLDGPDRPTAILTYGARTELYPMLYAAKGLGLSVPGDLSAVTFAEGPADDIGVRAATMVVPNREIGGAAVEMLARKIERPSRGLVSRAVGFSFVPGVTLARRMVAAAGTG